MGNGGPTYATAEGGAEATEKVIRILSAIGRQAVGGLWVSP